MFRKTIRPRSVLSLYSIPLVLLFVQLSALHGQTVQAPEPTVRNADWRISGDEIVVTYDLSAAGQGDYDVAVTLLNENDKSIRISLKSADGDIGTVRGPATGRTITWSYKKDLPDQTSGKGFYFGFDVKSKGQTAAIPEEAGSGFPLLAVLLVVGAVTGAVLLLSAGGQ